MKKIIVISLFFCCFHSAYSQDCFDKLAKQAVVIDSIQKVVIYNQQTILGLQKISKDLKDSIQTLKSDLLKLEKFKADKKNIDYQLKLKNDSIALLKNQALEKNQLILADKLKYEQKLLEEKEKGKNDVLVSIINIYKSNSFDDLIVFSTKLSVQHDMKLVILNSEVMSIMYDLEKYFNAKELLEKKFDVTKIKNAQVQLNQIKQKSELLDKLKENLEYYNDFNSVLKKTIVNLDNLDKEEVGDIDVETKKLKFNKIISELTNYMYDYYDYGNYPYLSAIVLDIIKRKKLHTDAVLTDLLEKL